MPNIPNEPTEAAARRYCRDCRFCRVKDTGLSLARCDSPNAAPLNVGQQYLAPDFDVAPFASTMREFANHCGPEGAWFEAKAAEQVAA
jgi:hypothetical protein